MTGYANPIRLEPRGCSARRVYMLWDDAVLVVTGPEALVTRDPLVSALFGPAAGASFGVMPGSAPPRRIRVKT